MMMTMIWREEAMGKVKLLARAKRDLRNTNQRSKSVSRTEASTDASERYTASF